MTFVPIPYIIRGDNTESNEFPFMAALGWKDPATGDVDYLAAGMLIALNFVLTVAHCVVTGTRPSYVKIGGNTLDSPQSNEVHEISNVFIYPQYDSTQAYNDIALLQLASTSRHPPVCLWTESKLFAKNVTAIGYGTTQFAGSRSDSLQKVKLVAFPAKVCKPFYRRKRRYRSGILDSQICAGDPEGKRDTCQGDSGGPLLIEHGNRTYAAGITSNGQACAGFPPAVYTRIASFFDWIRETVQQEGYPLGEDCDIGKTVADVTAAA